MTDIRTEAKYLCTTLLQYGVNNIVSRGYAFYQPPYVYCISLSLYISLHVRTGATELRALFDLLGQPVSYQKLFNIMEQYDVDESGQLDFGEFLTMYW